MFSDELLVKGLPLSQKWKESEREKDTRRKTGGERQRERQKEIKTQRDTEKERERETKGPGKKGKEPLTASNQHLTTRFYFFGTNTV